MSIMHVKEPDELVQCPYDPSHRVTALRFTRHIMKCQKNSTLKLVICPFNHQHRMPADERAKHITTCPDRIVVERDIFRENNSSGGDCSLPPTVPIRHIPCAEDWDAECSPGAGPAYNPVMQTKRSQFHNSSILSSLKPVDKRTYRRELHTKRFGDEVDESCDDSVDVVPILGMKKLTLSNGDVKGSYSQKSMAEQPQMKSSGFTSGPASVSSGPGSFSSGPQSWASVARGKNSYGPPSVVSDRSSINANSITSDANSGKSYSIKSSEGSTIFSLRGRGRGLRIGNPSPAS